MGHVVSKRARQSSSSGQPFSCRSSGRRFTTKYSNHSTSTFMQSLSACHAVGTLLWFAWSGLHVDAACVARWCMRSPRTWTCKACLVLFLLAQSGLHRPAPGPSFVLDHRGTSQDAASQVAPFHGQTESHKQRKIYQQRPEIARADLETRVGMHLL